MFISHETLKNCTWQALERGVFRLLIHLGCHSIHLVGQSRDGGADIIAQRMGKRWLVQVKRWKKPVPVEVVDETLRALRRYRASVPVIVGLSGFEGPVYQARKRLFTRHVPLQLWDSEKLIKLAANLPIERPILKKMETRDYQETAITLLVQKFEEFFDKKALVVMATGLGKTFVAAEALRRIVNNKGPKKIIFIVHTNELVYQLERAVWPFLEPTNETLVWNGYEHPSREDIERSNYLFVCLPTLYEHLSSGSDLPNFDIVIIDECHHVGGKMYLETLEQLQAGNPNGPFLIGLTATPWRPDEIDLKKYFGDPTVCVDMVTGLRKGYLSNVDYRMFTDNIDWASLKKFKGKKLTPKGINRTLFVKEWDDGVVVAFKRAWEEIKNPKALVFCGTIAHAITMRDKINSLRFCKAECIYSQNPKGERMSVVERNRTLCDFSDGIINVLCAVDIFNEGIDVPDVNIVVFQRVTHSRRIFVQQLGRGLRVAEGKKKVIVLDFVSDIRRFAAGLSLKASLAKREGPLYIKLNHSVTFQRVGGEDPKAENFLRQWLDDIAAIEGADENAAVLRFPPPLNEQDA